MQRLLIFSLPRTKPTLNSHRGPPVPSPPDPPRATSLLGVARWLYIQFLSHVVWTTLHDRCAGACGPRQLGLRAHSDGDRLVVVLQQSDIAISPMHRPIITASSHPPSAANLSSASRGVPFEPQVGAVGCAFSAKKRPQYARPAKISDNDEDADASS